MLFSTFVKFQGGTLWTGSKYWGISHPYIKRVFCVFFFIAYFKFYFIFKLYNIVLVLPNIEMNPPQVYMCSPSWTLLPPPSPYHPSGSSQCTSPKHLVSCIEPGLIWENGIETCILSCMKRVASQEGFESFSPVDLQKSGIIWDVIVMDAIDWTHYAPSSVLTTW